jgi:hypothetical protein
MCIKCETMIRVNRKKYNFLGGINSISPSFVKISCRAYFDLHASYIKFFGGFVSSSMDLQFLAISLYDYWAFIAGSNRSLLMWTHVVI